MNGAVRARAPQAGGLTAATPAFSIVIPAHDEEAVIARCLEAIRADRTAHAAAEIIVAVNGSSDRTACIAREIAPEARVIELPRASKAHAINCGFTMCTHAIRLVVDADVITSYRALAATAQALAQPGVMAASPAIAIDLSRSSALVRAYYRVWESLPYVTQRLVGGGVYGLSQAGYRALGEMPDIIADDLYVRTRFSFEARRCVAADAAGIPISTIIYPPRNMRDLIRTEARRLRGKRQVDRRFATAETGTINGGQALFGAIRQGASLSDVATYVAVKLLAKALYGWHRTNGRQGWSRDLSSRVMR